jgi:anaerobic ribonucleoside-triphosphate reductase activating protein
MAYNIRISDIEPESIVDGRGLRYSIFTQGCPHQCEGCHNPQTHDYNGGKLVDIDDLYSEICENPLLTGVTFSGGEPFLQATPLARLARMIHDKGLNVTTYTGFYYEKLLSLGKSDYLELLEQTDTLIDGPFVLERKDLELNFRGSSNQRIIDMNKTRQYGKIVLDELNN